MKKFRFITGVTFQCKKGMAYIELEHIHETSIAWVDDAIKNSVGDESWPYYTNNVKRSTCDFEIKDKEVTVTFTKIDGSQERVMINFFEFVRLITSVEIISQGEI